VRLGIRPSSGGPPGTDRDRQVSTSTVDSSSAGGCTRLSRHTGSPPHTRGSGKRRLTETALEAAHQPHPIHANAHTTPTAMAESATSGRELVLTLARIIKEPMKQTAPVDAKTAQANLVLNPVLPARAIRVRLAHPSWVGHPLARIDRYQNSASQGNDARAARDNASDRCESALRRRAGCCGPKQPAASSGFARQSDRGGSGCPRSFLRICFGIAASRSLISASRYLISDFVLRPRL